MADARASLRTCLALALLLAGSALAQVPTGTAPAPAAADTRLQQRRTCDALPAQIYLGWQATPFVVEQARQASGATWAWPLEPGVGIKGVVVEGRLLLGLDAAGMILSAHCA